MSKLPEPTETITTLIDKYHEQHTEGPREHFGLSQAGTECDRALWLNWRLAVIPKFPGRILRLFRRGHHEEYTVIDDLKAIGLKIENTGEDQRRVEASLFVQGSLDGIIKHGVPEAPKTEHILEIKTHNKKSFDELVKKGVQDSKPVHFIQMQCYMKLSRINRALYVAVCKDNDEIYTERVRLDSDLATHYIYRAKSISTAERIPDPINTDPSWYKCKMCDSWDMCHSTRTTKEINCRTCIHSTPDEKRGWTCHRWNDEPIPFDAQIKGCRSHVFHPDMVPWKPLPAKDQWTGVYEIDGQAVENGEGGFSSKEILTVIQNGGRFDDDRVNTVRKVFGGEIVE